MGLNVSTTETKYSKYPDMMWTLIAIVMVLYFVDIAEVTSSLSYVFYWTIISIWIKPTNNTMDMLVIQKDSANANHALARVWLWRFLEAYQTLPVSEYVIF